MRGRNWSERLSLPSPLVRRFKTSTLPSRRIPGGRTSPGGDESAHASIHQSKILPKLRVELEPKSDGPALVPCYFFQHHFVAIAGSRKSIAAPTKDLS